MTTSEITDALQKAARLRGEVEQLDHRAPKRRRSAERVFSFVTIALTCLVLIVLALDAWFAYDAFHSESPGSRTTSASSTADGPTYSNLQVFDDSGRFAGQIAITNPFDRDIEVFVNVDLYEGDQHVGEISGNVTLKPDSTSVVELDGFDDVVSYSESRVHLSGWPI